MKPIVDFSNAFSVVITLVLLILVVILGKENKKSVIPGIMLVVFMMILVGHTFEYSITNVAEIQIQISISLVFDFIFILLSFLSYLWIDEIECRDKNKKSIDNSLDWLWKKV